MLELSNWLCCGSCLWRCLILFLVFDGFDAEIFAVRLEVDGGVRIFDERCFGFELIQEFFWDACSFTDFR